MAEESAKLRIPYIAAAQAQKHVTHNEAMTLLDTLVQLSVKDKDLTVPPMSPAEGDCYIVAASATGAWTGWDKRVARFIDGEWRSYLLGAGSGAGWLAYVVDEAALYSFNGTDWVIAGLQLGSYIDLGEIATPASPGADVGRLYVKDVGGTTKLAFKDHAGTETVLGSGGGGGGSGGIKNRLINGGFRLFQRDGGVSTARSDDTYGPDRWNVLTQTAPINTSQQSDQEDGQPYSLRMTQNQVSAQRMGIEQIIESVNCRDLRGQSVVLSGRLRCSSSQAIRYAVLEWTGTSDSVTSDVVNSWTNATFTAGQFFNATSITVAAVASLTPSANTWTDFSLSAAISSSASNLIAIIWTEGTAAQNVTLDLGKVQLEKGSTATEFEFVPYQTELARCLRYLWQRTTVGTQDVVGLAQTISTTDAYAPIRFPAIMRVAPAFSVSAAGNFSQWQANSASSSCSALVAYNLSVADATLHGTATGLAAAGGASLVVGTTAAGWIRFDAEL